MRMKMKMKMNELKMNKLKKEMKNPSIISPSERFSEINNIVQLSIFMSISLRNFKMKPKHSFSYLSRPEKYSSFLGLKETVFCQPFFTSNITSGLFFCSRARAYALALEQKNNPR